MQEVQRALAQGEVYEAPKVSWDVTINIRLDYDRNYILATSEYPKRPGEDWHRGNDCGDGKMTEETVMQIAQRIYGLIMAGKPDKETVQ